MSAFLTYAKDKDGNLVHVDDVQLGLKCGCVCPNCGAQLCAKNGGQVKEHHFAHEHGVECNGAWESALHLLAKEVLSEARYIMLPDMRSGRYPSGKTPIRDVKIEQSHPEFGFRSDAEATLPNGEKLFIEFYNTHKVSGKKRETIVERDLKCIEINVKYERLDKKSLGRFLLEEPQDRWWVTRQYVQQQESHSSGYTRNPVFDKARDYLKKRFDESTLSIKLPFGYNQEKTFDLRAMGYDRCEPNGSIRGFKADLLFWRSTKETEEAKGYIAVSLRGRRRSIDSKIPRDIRIIDIIVPTMDEKLFDSYWSSSVINPRISETHNFNTGKIKSRASEVSNTVGGGPLYVTLPNGKVIKIRD